MFSEANCDQVTMMVFTCPSLQYDSAIRSARQGRRRCGGRDRESPAGLPSPNCLPLAPDRMVPRNTHKARAR